MKKRNTTTTPKKQRRMAAAKARRARRKIRMGQIITGKLRVLLVKFGQMEQQLKTQERELMALRPQPAQQPEVTSE